MWEVCFKSNINIRRKDKTYVKNTRCPNKGIQMGFDCDTCFMLLEVAVDTIIPLLMASIIDNGVNMGDTRHIYIMGVWMIVAALFGLLTGCLGAKYGAKAAMGFGKNLRAAMFRNIQTFSFANIDRFSSASLVTRMTTDVTNIQNAYMMLLRMAMRAPASIICAMAMTFFISPRLATIYLIAVIVLGALLLFISKAAMKYFDRAFRRYDDLNESVQENVSAIRVVKAYVREDYEKKRFSKAAQNYLRRICEGRKPCGIQLSAHAVYSVCLHPVNKLARSSYGGKQLSHYR